MLDLIVQLDYRLMYFFNVSLSNPIFDIIMPIVTHEWFVRIVFLLCALLAAIFGGKYGRITFVLLVLAVILSDLSSSQLIKPLVARLRPCKIHDWVHLLINCSSGKSFPSSHAANSFGQALIWIWRYPKYKWFFLLSAIIISFSRVVVGVHYPFDILSGAILGTLCALLLFFSMRILNRYFAGNKALDKSA